MKISLLMVTSQGVAKEVPVASLPIVIGRGADCKLRIPVDSVSRAHCELLENDDEELAIRDLKSSNGTFVNKQRVKEKELVPGDLLSIGPMVFVVKIDGHPKDVDPVTAFASGAVAVGGGSAMIDGVPTWSGSAPAAPHAPAHAPAPTKPAAAPPKPAAKKSANDDSDAFDDLLKDLSESDFDIDFGEGNPPKKTPPGKK